MKYRINIVKLADEPLPMQNIEDGTTCYNVDNGALYMYYKGDWYLQDFSDESEG